MSEALVSIVVAVVAGGAALNNRLHNRINSVHERISALDRRLDGVELTVASDYVKAELAELLLGWKITWYALKTNLTRSRNG